MQSRPSVHELNKRIGKSKELVSEGKIRLVNNSVIATDAIELGYQVTNLQEVLLCLLSEIQANNYAGQRPPEKAYDSQIKGAELFVFIWLCTRFGCEVYFKFCIKEGLFYLVSLHPNR